MNIMISLSAYSATKGLYKKADIIGSDKPIFDKLCNELDLPEKDEFHCTIMWSKSEVFLTDSCRRNDKYIAMCDRIDYLDGHDGTYIVAHISSDRLRERHKEFLELGCETTFPDYTPHVTLGKDVQKSPELSETIHEINTILKERPIVFTMVETDVEDVKS